MSLIHASRAHTRRVILFLGLAILALGSALSPAVRARDLALLPSQEEPEGYTQGIPWAGEPGVTLTVAQLMAREKARPRAAEGHARQIKPRPPLPLKTATDPSSPETARWPAPEETGTAELAPAPYLPQAIGVNFRGVSRAGPPAESFAIPPDSMGAVGPSQILVATNGRVKVFDKSGGLGSLNVTDDTFWSPVSGGAFVTDPHIRYDRLSGRWFLTILNVPTVGGNAMGPNRILIAVSSGSTVTSTASFTYFQFQQDLVGPTPNSDTNGLADYDTLGVDKNALYIAVNVFNQNGSAFIGSTGFVVNKANLIAGMLTVTAFRQLNDGVNPGIVTPQGVDNDDPAASEGYFIGPDLVFFSRLVVRRVVNPGGAPSISANLNVGVPTTASPISVLARGNPFPLDALDDRLFAAHVHKNKITGVSSLWTAHNIQVDSSGVANSSGGRNGSRWYEIQNLTTTPTLNQSGTLFDPSASNPRSYWIPSVAMSGQGHVALGSSFAGVNDFAGVAVSGRLSGDAAGSTRAASIAQPGLAAYDDFITDPQRWGDYSQTTVDPNDDMTLWTVQEYAESTAQAAWAVRVVQLRAPAPATPASASPSSVPGGQSSVSVTINGTSVSGSGFFDPGPDAGGPGFPSHIAASVSGGVIVNSVTFNGPTQVVLNISTVGVSPGAKDVTITNPDGQSATGVGVLTVQAPTLSINDVSVPEGNTGTTNAVFTVTLSWFIGQPVTVNFATADGTATAGSDYGIVIGTVTFPPGTTTQTLAVPVIGDRIFEPNETFFVNLSGPVNATIADGQGMGTILDDDPPGLSVNDVTVVEGTTAVFTVTLSPVNPTQTVTVNYTTANGTATAGSDYQMASGTLTFPPGTATQPISVITNMDSLVEGAETYFVNLSVPVNAAIAYPQGTGTILDPQGGGDFNGDGKPDLLWRNQATGDNLVWFMNGTTLAGGAVLTSVTDTSWNIVGTADFNADGKTDILWRNQASGDNLVWFMNGTTLAGGAVLTAISDTNWRIVATGDFNGDGKPDILWRNQSTGDNIVWFMNGTTLAGGAVLTAIADTNWKIVGAGDFNGDGKPDILWRNQATGDNLVWFMNGTTIAGGAVLTSVGDVSWAIVGVGDFNGDGKPDIVWRNQASGDNLVWFMNGTTLAGGAVLTSVTDTNWKIVGPR